MQYRIRSLNYMLTILGILVLFYIANILLYQARLRNKRKYLEVGDICKVYLGENKLTGFILEVNDEVDVWVANRIVRLSRDQIYI